jgi:hypothetical protein
MNVPFGDLWAATKLEILEAIPDGIDVDLSRALSFYDWRHRGGYHVTGATKAEYHLSCSTREFGSMLAREVSMLLDQAMEHRLLLAQAERAGTAPSPSWLLVTAYYWCVFLALAWLRLVGKVVTYLPTAELDRFKRLAPAVVKKAPQNGTFLLSTLDLAGARSNVTCRRLRANNFHEALWTAFADDISQRLRAPSNATASWETRLYSALEVHRATEGNSWPSKLRNIVNYRVGFGYQACDGHLVPIMQNPLNAVKSATPETLITTIEDLHSRIAARAVEAAPNDYTQLLVYFGSLITHVLEDYCVDVWATRGIDRRWNARRNAYLRSFDMNIATLWPK